MSNYTEGIQWAVGEGFFYSLNVEAQRRPKAVRLKRQLGFTRRNEGRRWLKR